MSYSIVKPLPYAIGRKRSEAMYYLISFVTAMLVSAMVTVNGNLSGAYGTYLSTAIIHAVGIVPATLIALARRERLFDVRGLKPGVFLGGAIGVVTVVCNNAAYTGGISVSAMVALSLLGQTVASLLVDQFGLFRMPAKRFNRAKLLGLLCTAAGIACMLCGAAPSALPVLLSFLMGVTIVLSRSVNAMLAKKTSLFVSTWYNYSVGLSVSLAVWLLAGLFERVPLLLTPAAAPPLWAFFGGLMGVVTVSVQSFVTPRMPAFQLTLVLFIGQVFTGLLIDALSGAGGSAQEWIGGAFAVAGLSLNALLDRRAERVRALEAKTENPN